MADSLQTQRVRGALFYGFLALLAWLTFLVFEPFFTPLIWAAVIVVLFMPWHRRLERRVGKLTAAAASTVVATAILIVPILIVMAAFVHQAILAFGSVGAGTFLNQAHWLGRVWSWAAHLVPAWWGMDLAALTREGAQRLTEYLGTELEGVVRNVILFLFDMGITIIAMFYFFRDADLIMRWLRRTLPLAEEQREGMIRKVQDLVFVTVASSLAAAGVTGLVGGVAFWAVGMHAVVFWGVVMSLFALLPVVGAWIIWIPAAGWLVAEGHPGRAIALLAICGVAILAIDNVMRPMIISGRVELNGLLVLVGVLGGITVFGPIGVVLGPVVVAVAAGLLQAYSTPRAVEGGDGAAG